MIRVHLMVKGLSCTLTAQDLQDAVNGCIVFYNGVHRYGNAAINLLPSYGVYYQQLTRRLQNASVLLEVDTEYQTSFEKIKEALVHQLTTDPSNLEIYIQEDDLC